MEVSGRKDRETPKTSTELEIYCTPCKADGRQETVEGYCEVCHEYLCHVCISCHKRFRITKDHRIQHGGDIPTETQTDLHIDISCTEVCEIHPGKLIEYFCEDHDVVGCGPCTTIEHRTCKVSFIPDVAKDYRDSDDYKTILSTMKDVDSQLIQLEDQLAKYDKENEDIHSTAMDDIRRFRTEINTFLDEKEEKLLEKAKTLKLENEKVLQDVRNFHKQLHKKFTEIDKEMQKHTNQVAKLFLIAKCAKKSLRKLKLECNIAVSKSNIMLYHFEASQNIKEIISVQNDLGEIVKGHKICISKLDLSSPHKIKITHSNDTTRAFIAGMCWLSSDRLLTADYWNKSLKLIRTCSQDITSTLGLTSEPHDVTCLPNDMAAVALVNENKIQIVSSRGGLSRVREIKVSDECWGICYSDGKLIITLCPGQLEIIGLNGTVYKTVTRDNKGNNIFRHPYYVTLQSLTVKKNIYVSDWKTNTVTKLSVEGGIVSQFQDQRLFDSYGLVALGDNHIAVCSNGGHKITVIRDEDGKMEIVKQWDCVKYPRAIEFSPYVNKLYVSSGASDEQNHVHVYSFAE